MRFPDCTYTAIAEGDAEVMGEAAAPLAEAVEELIPYHSQPLPKELELRRTGPQNSFPAPVVIGLILFVTNELTKRFLADIYDELIKSRVKPVLEKIDQRLSGANAKNKKSFTCSLWLQKPGVLIRIEILGNSYKEIAQRFDLIPVIYMNALGWIVANGSQKPIHKYTVENGRVNAAPALYDRLDMVK